MRSRCSARAISSRCTDDTSASSSDCSSRVRRAQGEQLALAHGAGLLGGVALGRGDGQRDLEPGQGGDGTGADRRGDGRRPGPRLAALGVAHAGRALGGGGALELLGPTGQGAAALLAGAHGEPGLDLGLTRQHGGLGEPVALLGATARPRRAASWAAASRAVSSSSVTWSASRAAVADAIDGGEPLGLAGGGARRRAELAELLGDGGHPGVGLVQPRERGLDPRLGGRGGLGGPGELEAHPLAAVRGLGRAGSRASSTAACTSSSEGALAEPPCATPGREHVALARDRDDVGVRRGQVARPRRGRRRPRRARARPGPSRRSSSGARTRSTAHRAPAGSAGQDARSGTGAPPTSSDARPASSDLSRVDGVDGARHRPDRDGVGQRAERGRDRGLVAGLDVHERGDRAEHARRAGRRPRGPPRRRPCAPGRARAPRRGRRGRAARARPPAPRAAGRAAGSPTSARRRGGGLVLLVEADLALVEPGDLRLERVEVLRGLLGAGARLGDLALQPLDLGRAGLEPRASRRAT